MKSIIHLLFFLIACTSSYAQSNQAIVMKDDANGNRTDKEVITLTQTRSLSGTQDEEIFENEFIGEKEIRVYPNPTKGQLQIKIIGTSTNLPKTVTLIGMNGSVLIRKSASDNEYTLDLSSLSSGMYILSIHMEDMKKEFKIIKE